LNRNLNNFSKTAAKSPEHIKVFPTDSRRPGGGGRQSCQAGAKGSRWAWRNGRWDSLEHFKRVQRLWAIWGVVIWISSIALFGGIFGGAFYLLGHSEAYQLGVSKLRDSPVAASVLGTPISTGMPSGSIRISGGSGSAALSFSATGTKAAGVVFLEAIKKDGVWSINRLTLKVNGSDGAIDLINSTRGNTT
jgi:hypothetical protein